MKYFELLNRNIKRYFVYNSFNKENKEEIEGFCLFSFYFENYQFFFSDVPLIYKAMNVFVI